METFEIELGRQSIDMGGTRTIEQGEPTTKLQSTLQEQGLAANTVSPSRLASCDRAMRSIDNFRDY